MGGKGGATGTGRDEEIADGGEDGNEPLQASRKSKALHRPLASSQRQVRVLRPSDANHFSAVDMVTSHRF